MSLKYLRIVSDLHLEGFIGRNPETLRIDFIPNDERDAETILILAGDISSQGEQLLAFLNVCCERFPKVYYVAGNHEFYKHDYQAYPKELIAAIANRQAMHGVFMNLETSFTDVSYEELDDPKVRFIFAPMWGDGGPTLADQGKTGFYLNDFRLITNGRYDTKSHALRRFTVQDMMLEHKRQKAEIVQYLKQPFEGKTVVITHHLPSRRLVSKRFWPTDGSDGANGGFVGNCDDILAYDHAPDLWIHGHTHDTIDTSLWKTRIVCNPAGYRGEYATPYNTFMQPAFDPNQPKIKPVVVPKIIAIGDL